ncbi:MAG: SDR family oxidoreductase [Comamonadaceae bacterium]|nr:SDR family oxidoreductase [Comamonadaceae bacterium]
MPPAERRRASRIIKLALALAREARGAAEADPETLRTVFVPPAATATTAMRCASNWRPTSRISPTCFHNSVHNAAAGYWDIATRSMQPGQVIRAHDASFGAGLLDALAQVGVEAAPVLLVAYDSEYPEPIFSKRPIPDAAGIALLLAPHRSQRSAARIVASASRAPRRAWNRRIGTVATADSAMRALPPLRLLYSAANWAASVSTTCRRCNWMSICRAMPGPRLARSPILPHQGSDVPAGSRHRSGRRTAIACRARQPSLARTTRCARTAASAQPAASSTPPRRWRRTARCWRRAGERAARGLPRQRARRRVCTSARLDDIAADLQRRGRAPVRRRQHHSVRLQRRATGGRCLLERPRHRGAGRRQAGHPQTTAKISTETRPGHRRQRRHRRGDLLAVSPPTAITCIVHANRNLAKRAGAGRCRSSPAAARPKPIAFDVTDADASRAALEALLADGADPGAGEQRRHPRRRRLPRHERRRSGTACIDVSLNGFFNVTQPLTLPMLRTRWGRIISITSVAGWSAIAGRNYAAAKGALHAATKSLAIELAEPRHHRQCRRTRHRRHRNDRGRFDTEAIKRLVPMQRAGTSDEVADLVAFLASRQAAYITGQVISINGGMICEVAELSVSSRPFNSSSARLAPSAEPTWAHCQSASPARARTSAPTAVRVGDSPWATIGTVSMVLATAISSSAVKASAGDDAACRAARWRR